MAAAELLCPECGTPYEQGDFQCTNCELILDVDAAQASLIAAQQAVKQATIDTAKRIGTYDISVRPGADCCSLLVAKHPKTSSTPVMLDRKRASDLFNGRVVMGNPARGVTRRGLCWRWRLPAA